MSVIDKRSLPHKIIVSITDAHIERAKSLYANALELAVSESLGISVDSDGVWADGGYSISVVDDDGSVICDYSSTSEAFVRYQRAMIKGLGLMPAEFELSYEGVAIALIRDDNFGHYSLVDCQGQGRRLVGIVPKSSVRWLTEEE